MGNKELAFMYVLAITAIVAGVGMLAGPGAALTTAGLVLLAAAWAIDGANR